MSKHDSLDDTAQRRARNYQRLGLNEDRVELLRREYGTTTDELEALSLLADVTTGRAWQTLDGEPYVLTDSMTGWFGNKEYVRHGLQQKGLIDRHHGRYNKVYYRLTDAAWDLLVEDYPYDLGEGWLHKRGVALLRTLYHGLVHFTGVTSYAHIGVNNKRCDLRVIPEDPEARALAAKHDFPPGTDAILCEVMLDHNNYTRVVDRYHALKRAGHDALWVFENREVMNKWIGRLADTPEFADAANDYAWSPGTPIDTVNQRLKRWNDSGMRAVTTIDSVERRIDSTPEKFQWLAHAPDLG